MPLARPSTLEALAENSAAAMARIALCGEAGVTMTKLAKSKLAKKASRFRRLGLV